MKKNYATTVWLFIVFAVCQTISAQFPVKIPKINKPKIEQPKTEQPDANSSAPSEAKSDESRPAQRQNQVRYLSDPEAPKAPQILVETMEIKAHNQAKYFKTPGNNDNPSWFPQVGFDVLYDHNQPNLRFTADWTNADGSLWFANQIDGTQSRTSNELFDTKATDDAGVFGFRLLNTKTKAVVFQGKFKVNRVLTDPNDARYKNVAMFYVEHDENLPVGYVGFDDHDEGVTSRRRAFIFGSKAIYTRKISRRVFFTITSKSHRPTTAAESKPTPLTPISAIPKAVSSKPNCAVTVCGDSAGKISKSPATRDKTAKTPTRAASATRI